MADYAEPSDLPDDGLIDRSKPAAIIIWARIPGTPTTEIWGAIVAPADARVRDYLLRSRTEGHARR
jgi:hypothetical protein